MQVGPEAILLPDKTAQDAVFATDKMDGKTSFILPEEERAPEVVTEKVYEVTMLTVVIVAEADPEREPATAVST